MPSLAAGFTTTDDFDRQQNKNSKIRNSGGWQQLFDTTSHGDRTV